MTRFFTTSILLATLPAFALAGQSHTEALRAQLESRDRSYVFVTMHRGDWRHAPENSVGAIKGSIEIGADIVELERRRTDTMSFFTTALSTAYPTARDRQRTIRSRRSRSSG